MNLLIYCYLLFNLITSSAFTDAKESSLLPENILQEPTSQLIIHNQILAHVNGKTISVWDVMKKMDFFLHQYYPERAKSIMARFQFYSAQWRTTLDQIIDNELILADAEQVELKIQDAEIREQMIERFGHNLIATLDHMGLSYEEAREMIYTENIVERMTWYRIHNNVLQNVGPQDIKTAYQQWRSEQAEDEIWTYQTVSIRSSNAEKALAAAEKAHALLQDEQHFLTSLPSLLQETDVAVMISQEYTLATKDISLPHREVLSSLTTGKFSSPVAQISKKDHQSVFRIFYLKEHTKKSPPSFTTMATELHEKLLQDAATKRANAYKQKLRQRFGFFQDQELTDFQPFSLSR